MSFFAKVKEVAAKAVNAIKKHSTAVMATATLVATNPIGVMAAGNVEKAKWAGNGNLDDMMGSVIGIMLTVARYAGMALTIWGIVKTVMAYKDDNVNEITQGIRLAVVGVIMVTLKTILSTLGFVS